MHGEVFTIIKSPQKYRQYEKVLTNYSDCMKAILMAISSSISLNEVQQSFSSPQNSTPAFENALAWDIGVGRMFFGSCQC